MRWRSCDEANVVWIFMVPRPQILDLFALILFTQNTYILTEKEWPKFLNKRSHVVYEKISENQPSLQKYLQLSSGFNSFISVSLYVLDSFTLRNIVLPHMLRRNSILISLLNCLTVWTSICIITVFCKKS